MKYRAIVCHELGTPDVLRVEEIEAPPLGAGQARVRIRACGVNFPDLLMVAGKYQFRPALPFIPGFESAGEVIEAAAGAQVEVGSRVIVRGKTGGFAEQTVASPHELFPAPGHYSYNEAATYSVGFLTAWNALVTRARLQAGESVLVAGAAGGVGMAAVALSRHLGATPIALCSTPEKCAAALKAGAAHAIDSSARRVDEAVADITRGSGVGCVYDPVGLAPEIALRCLSWGGRILLIGFAGAIPVYPANRILLKGASVLGVRAGEFGRHFPREREEELKRIEALTKVLRPFVSRAYPLAEAARALQDLAERRAIGRIVLNP